MSVGMAEVRTRASGSSHLVSAMLARVLVRARVSAGTLGERTAQMKRVGPQAARHGNLIVNLKSFGVYRHEAGNIGAPSYVSRKSAIRWGTRRAMGSHQ
jgi:hypothetical protein